jgi:plasmid stabilization system protein ParE
MDRWPVAIGDLPGHAGVWVGIERGPDGFHLVFGESITDLHWQSPASGHERTDELLASAVAYFQESLPSPTPEIEATQADLGDLVRWLAADETDDSRRRWLQEVVDAIDDGLAADVVIRRLSLVRGGSETVEQADVVDLLVRRYQSRREG